MRKGVRAAPLQGAARTPLLLCLLYLYKVYIIRRPHTPSIIIFIVACAHCARCSSSTDEWGGQLPLLRSVIGGLPKGACPHKCFRKRKNLFAAPRNGRKNTKNGSEKVKNFSPRRGMGEKNQKILPLCGAHSEKSLLFSTGVPKKFFPSCGGQGRKSLHLVVFTVNFRKQSKKRRKIEKNEKNCLKSFDFY